MLKPETWESSFNPLSVTKYLSGTAVASTFKTHPYLTPRPPLLFLTYNTAIAPNCKKPGVARHGDQGTEGISEREAGDGFVESFLVKIRSLSKFYAAVLGNYWGISSRKVT